MKQILFCFLLFVSFTDLFGQDAGEIVVLQHRVKPGETVRMLSKKYLVSPANIYALNKFAVNGIEEGMILDIPVSDRALKPAVKPPEKVNVPDQEPIEEPFEPQGYTPSLITHEVKSGETLSSISRKYRVSVADIQSQNASILSNGLKSGQLLTIALNADEITQQNDDHNEVEHRVTKGETLHSIAHKYGVSVEELKQQNEKLLGNGLQAGQVIKFKKNN